MSTPDQARAQQLQNQIQHLTAEEILSWAAAEFPKVRLASSLSHEDQVLAHMIHTARLPIGVFVLDTGRLFNETYEVLQRSMEMWDLNFELFAPDTATLEALISRSGPNAFYKSIEERKACCKVRKVEPLKRALQHLDAWITGIRRAHAITRQDAETVEWDDQHNLFKLNPLNHWSEQQVWSYLQKHNIPFNKLHYQGFRSIGCAPCTRATRAGEDVRAGRWWWENPEQKECGLHRTISRR